MNKTKLILATLVLTVVSVVAVFGIGKVFADTNSKSTLVQMIAQKFNLNQSDVQSVFDQYRQDRRSQMEAQFKTRLDQDVASGKITADQETLILNKRKELADNRASQMANFKNMTQAERQAAWQKDRQDLTDWAKQNGIDIQYFFGGFGHMGGGHGFGMKNGQSEPAPAN